MQNKRRFAVMCLGIVILGLGICLFKLSLMGNDPCSAFTMSLGNRVGLDFSIMILITNSVYFIVEILFGRNYIGAGTFVNWCGVGFMTTFFERIITGFWEIPTGFGPRLMIMLVGILVLSLASSMYQTADMGIAPYDCLSIVMSERFHLPYFWCRIFTDSACALFAYLLGGIIGIGTLICALGLGPFIEFFNGRVSRKLCGLE